MEHVIPVLIFGLSYSALLFLISVSLSLMFGLMRFVNLASGSFYILGAYIGITIGRSLGNYLAALVGAALAMATIGLLLERGLLRWVHGRIYEQVLLTMGLAYCFQDLSRWLWGAEPLSLELPTALTGTVHVWGASVPIYRLLLIAAGLVMGFGIWLGIERTRLGAYIRAGVDDTETLETLGVDTERVFTLVVVVAAVLAGFGGALGAPITGVAPGTDFEMLLLALVVVVVGGLGSISGAMIGSLAVGLVDSVVRTLLPQASLFVIYALMTLVLVARPEGLLSRTVR